MVVADVDVEAVRAGVAWQTETAVAAACPHALRVRVVARLAHAVPAGAVAARVAHLAVLAAVQHGAHAHVVAAGREAMATVLTGATDAGSRRLAVVTAVALRALTQVAAPSVEARASVAAGIKTAVAALQELTAVTRVAGQAPAAVGARPPHGARAAVLTRGGRARRQQAARHAREVSAAAAPEAAVTRN